MVAVGSLIEEYINDITGQFRQRHFKFFKITNYVIGVEPTTLTIDLSNIEAMKEAERNISALDQAITAYLMSENDQTASTTKTQTNATGTSTAETSLDFKTDADEQRQNMSAQRHASSQSNRSQDPSSKGQQNLKQPSIDHRICDDTEEIDSKDLRSGDPFLQGYERQIDVSEHPHGLAEDSHVAGTIPSSSQDAPPDFQIPHIDSWSIPCDAQKSPQVVWDLEDLKRRAQAYSQAQTQNPQSPLSEGSQIVEESAPRLAQAESLVQKANRLEEEEPELSIVDQLKILWVHSLLSTPHLWPLNFLENLGYKTPLNTYK